MRRMFVVAAALVVSATSVGVRASEAGTEIDLANLSEIGSTYTAETTADESAFAEVEYSGTSPASRFYLSGIMGSSFARGTAGGENQVLSLPGVNVSIGQNGASDQTLFTGGAALGLALDRPLGQLRMEVEGRWRDPVVGTANGFIAVNGTPLASTDLDFRFGSGWSAMTNFWRDFDVTNRFGVYAGGGFGAGGYQYQTSATPIPGLSINGQNSVMTFAWQVGVGGVYKVSDRITVDAGYRFFALGETDLPVTANVDIPPVGIVLPLGNFSSAFSASELLFTVRIYEPFRNWR